MLMKLLPLVHVVITYTSHDINVVVSHVKYDPIIFNGMTII
jgi:hypothetical protein